MNKLEPNWNTALKFWWSWTWRSVLAALVIMPLGFLLSMVLAYIIGLAIKFLSIPKVFLHILPFVAGLLIFLFYFLLSLRIMIFVMMRLLTKGTNGFEIILVDKKNNKFQPSWRLALMLFWSLWWRGILISIVLTLPLNFIEFCVIKIFKLESLHILGGVINFFILAYANIYIFKRILIKGAKGFRIELFAKKN